MHLWDRILNQTLITLNLIYSSHINPFLSVHVHLQGMFNLNQTPIAPPSMQVKIHKRPLAHAFWNTHLVYGLYIGPAREHYWCYQVWVSKTNSKHTSDTLAWFPTQVTILDPSSSYRAINAAKTLTDFLRRPALPGPVPPPSINHSNALPPLQYICHACRCTSKGGNRARAMERSDGGPQAIAQIRSPPSSKDGTAVSSTNRGADLRSEFSPTKQRPRLLIIPYQGAKNTASGISEGERSTARTTTAPIPNTTTVAPTPTK